MSKKVDYSKHCKKCGGTKGAHFEPEIDVALPQICMCGMPDSPCGCTGYEPRGKK